jgi:hypothetical protein
VVSQLLIYQRVRLCANLLWSDLALQYTMAVVGTNIKQALDAMRFHIEMLKGGSLTLQNLETGFLLPCVKLTKQPIDDGTLPWVSLLEKIAFIQDKTRILFMFPDRVPTPNEASNILTLVDKIETGGVTSTGEVTLGLVKEGVDEFLEKFGQGGRFQVTWENWNEEILGVVVPMGPCSLTCTHAYVSQEEIARVKGILETAQQGQTVSVTLYPTEGHQMIMRYPRWESANG